MCRRQSPEGAEDGWPCLSCPAVRHPHKNGLEISKIPKDLHPPNLQDSFKSHMHRDSSIHITPPKIWPRLIPGWLGCMEGKVSDPLSEHLQPLTPLCHLLRGLWFHSRKVTEGVFLLWGKSADQELSEARAHCHLECAVPKQPWKVIVAAFKHSKKEKNPTNLSFWKLSACLSGSYLNTINKQMILKLQYI